MKDKLIELLYRAHHNASAVMAGGEGSYEDGVSEEAAYLIANGVVLLPIIPGQKVYDTIEFYDGTKHPDIFHYSDDWICIAVEGQNGEYRFSYDSTDVRHADIGKTVFFSQEEAEASLRKDGDTDG